MIRLFKSTKIYLSFLTSLTIVEILFSIPFLVDFLNQSDELVMLPLIVSGLHFCAIIYHSMFFSQYFSRTFHILGILGGVFSGVFLINFILHFFVSCFGIALLLKVKKEFKLQENILEKERLMQHEYEFKNKLDKEYLEEDEEDY